MATELWACPICPKWSIGMLKFRYTDASPEEEMEMIIESHEEKVHGIPPK